VSCAICHTRKEKRFCLALHDRICPQCCGEQREVTLDCPSECPYLQQARQHEKPREIGDTPPEELFSNVAIKPEFLEHHQGLIAGLLQIVLRAARSDRDLRDREIAGALTSMARSYQTLVTSGLVYQQPSANPAQAAIVEALQRGVEEVRKLEQQHLGYSALRDADVLRALVFMIRLAYMHSNGRPLSRAFIDSLQSQFPEPAAAGAAGSGGGSRIILP